MCCLYLDLELPNPVGGRDLFFLGAWGVWCDSFSIDGTFSFGSRFKVKIAK